MIVPPSGPFPGVSTTNTPSSVRNLFNWLRKARGLAPPRPARRCRARRARRSAAAVGRRKPNGSAAGLPSAGSGAVAAASSSASVKRCDSASSLSGEACIAAVRTILPFNFPLNFSRSSGPLITAIIACPVTGPFVPGDQGCAKPMMGWNSGSFIIAAKRVGAQPRPNGPHFSIFTLTRPHSCIFLTAQLPASLILGDPVSRGPYTSVR